MLALHRAPCILNPNSTSVHSASARRSTSSSSKTRSRSLSSYASCTRRCRLKTTNCATTSSTSNLDCLKHKARYPLHQPASISIDHMPSKPICTRSHSRLRPHNSLNSSSSSSRLKITPMEACRSVRLANCRWQPKQPPQLNTAQLALNTPTLIAHTTTQRSAKKSMNLLKVSHIHYTLEFLMPQLNCLSRAQPLRSMAYQRSRLGCICRL
jgi:hypothetical protein